MNSLYNTHPPPANKKRKVEGGNRENITQNSNSPRIEMDDLPDELLGLIIQRMWSWRERVRAERVSPRWRRVALAHGWANVKCLGMRSFKRELCWMTDWRGPLLSRAGPSLITLFIERMDGGTPTASALCDELEKCPNLKHLGIWWNCLDQPTLDYMRHTYGGQLKLLQLSVSSCPFYLLDSTALGQALRSFPALECLEIFLNNSGTERGFKLIEFPRLHASSLVHLRHFLIHKFGQPPLSAENFEVLASLPSLRSLEMDHNVPLADFSFLKRLSHLENLEVVVAQSNAESFIEALSHLGGGNLKALGVKIMHKPVEVSYTMLERLISAIVTEAPRLEHLYLRTYISAGWGRFESESGKSMFEPLISMKNLRSLALLGRLLSHISYWGWLEKLSYQLEYLELEKPPPLTLLLNMAKHNTNLRDVSIRGLGSSSTMDGPKFVPSRDVRSRVLDRYRYGCSSEERSGLTWG